MMLDATSVRFCQLPNTQAERLANNCRVHTGCLERSSRLELPLASPLAQALAQALAVSGVESIEFVLVGLLSSFDELSDGVIGVGTPHRVKCHRDSVLLNQTLG